MTTLFIIGLVCLAIAALSRIIWVAMKVGLMVLWAIPTFILLFIGLSLMNPWGPAIVAIIFILMFNKNAEKRMKNWM